MGMPPCAARRPPRISDEALLQKPKMGVGTTGRPGDKATQEPGPYLAHPSLLRLRGGGSSNRHGFGHPVGQRGDEAGGLLRRQPERPGADVPLPQGDDHGGIRLMGGDSHPPQRAPGVEEPGSLTVQVALDRHGPSMAPGTFSGYWSFERRTNHLVVPPGRYPPPSMATAEEEPPPRRAPARSGRLGPSCRRSN